MAGLEYSTDYRRDLEKKARKLFEETPHLSLKQLAEGIKQEHGSGHNFCTIGSIYRKLRREFFTCPTVEVLHDQGGTQLSDFGERP